MPGAEKRLKQYLSHMAATVRGLPLVLSLRDWFTLPESLSFCPNNGTTVTDKAPPWQGESGVIAKHPVLE